jgi:hypothetical protein
MNIFNFLFSKKEYFKYEIIDLDTGKIIQTEIIESNIISFTDYEKRLQYIFKKY